jgi:predicted kinase
MSIFVVRGVVGSGKTAVSETIAKRCKALRLSTDGIRKEVAFDDSVKLGDTFRTDDAYKRQQRLVYEVLLIAAKRHGDDPETVFEDLVKDLDYMTLSSGEKKRLLAWLKKANSTKAKDIVLEATFSKEEQLRRAIELVHPVIIDVQVDDAVIRARLAKRGLENESMADSKIYEAMKQFYKPASAFGIHSHVVHNNGTKEELEKAVVASLKEIGSCKHCRETYK